MSIAFLRSNLSLLPSAPKPLPLPPHYMRMTEQQQVRNMAETGPLGRPAGDHRSAERIIEQSSTLTHFLGTCDHYEVGDNLKMHVGDWTAANASPESRADAAYNLDQVLRFIDNVDERTLDGSQERSGVVEGFSNYGYTTQENSEAHLLKQFSAAGYSALRNLPT
ncbi:hypothetical protein OOJ96_10550 [Pseudomonas sp. 15FMM2]|uniref:Uncharacterized protein n=1 Tax=Pseudomonas imrae TaxID=2992837 RepID=A0ACC7PEZ5_9PSED